MYHTQTVSSALYGSGKGYRSPHINKLVHNADGSLRVAANYEGVKQLSNLNPYQRVEAETFAWNGRILTEASSAPGGPVNNQHVTNIQNGDWVALGNVDFGSNGARTFKANVASTVGGKIEVRLGGANGRLVGTLNVPSTGGTQNWREIETSINGASGVHNVFLSLPEQAGNLFQFDSWQFTQR